MKIENAVITSTMLGTERGIFTAWIYLDYGGAGQGFGGYVLATKSEPKNFGATYLVELLETLEVESWEKLPGTSVRTKTSGFRTVEIGHYLKDQWFSFEKTPNQQA